MVTGLLVLLVIGLPWLGALTVWLVPNKQRPWHHGLAVTFAAVAAVVSLFLIPRTAVTAVWQLEMGPVWGELTLVADSLGVFLAIVAMVIGTLSLVFSVNYMQGEAQLRRYYVLVLLFIGAMAGLVLSGHLILLFIFWEITALCSYALISFYNDKPEAVAGGLKALVMTQLGGIGLLVGVLTAMAYLGDGQISTLLARGDTLPGPTLQLIAWGFLLAAVAKSAQVPLHSWLPAAMEAPTPVSALIHAATMVNAGVYLLARFYPLFQAVPGWQTAVITVAVISALVAAVMALTAHDLKRVLAYSTISQLGYMVYAVGVGAIMASLWHLFSHAIFKALLFLAAGAIIHAVGTRDMRQMGDLRRQMPVVTALFYIGAGALAGLPFLNGFWSKELVLEQGLAHGPTWAYGGMLVGVGLTALYTIRMTWLVFGGTAKTFGPIHDAPPVMQAALWPLALGTLTSWFIVGPFSHWLAQTLPLHHLEVVATWSLLAEIVTHPATLAALLVIGLSALLWWQRARWHWFSQSGGIKIAEAGFGFEAVNRWLVIITQRGANWLSITQTGQFNWNLVGVVIGFVLVLLVLAGSA